jgi:hypothetical protein
VSQPPAPPTPARRRLLPRATRQGRPYLWTELALIVVGYSLYTVTRNAVPGQKAIATRRAGSILRFEHALHIDVELTINHAIDKITPLIVGMNYYYATLHFIVTIGVLVWLYVRHPQAYRSERIVLFVVTVSSLVGFYFYALAPPRFLPGAGFINTVVTHHTWGSWGNSGVDSVSNQYAAMPSDHIAWSGWCGIMLYRYAGHRWLRIAGLLYPLFTFTVILATGNHFVLDAVFGALNLGMAFGIRYAATKLWRRRSARQAQASPPTLPTPRAQHDGGGHQGTLGEQRGVGDAEPAVEQRDC